MAKTLQELYDYLDALTGRAPLSELMAQLEDLELDD
jgi:hypothetical protein